MVWRAHYRSRRRHRYMGSQLCDRSKGGAGERLVGQDREPNLDLIEPGGARRREMKVDVGMAGKPAVGLRLMGVEVVEDDVKDRKSTRLNSSHLGISYAV